jgi:hypothetical protein
MHACPFACLGAPAICCFWFPDLKNATETHEHHGLGKSGITDERVGQNYTTFLVRLDRKRIRIEGG